MGILLIPISILSSCYQEYDLYPKALTPGDVVCESTTNDGPVIDGNSKSAGDNADAQPALLWPNRLGNVSKRSLE
jgi:hypothetical protein